MPVDVDAVLIDIKSLIEQKAGIRLTRHSNSKDGPEYHGPCPFCSGKDRFVVWTSIGRYSCAIRSSGCGRYGDAIDFLRNYPYEGAMTYTEACDELGLDVDPAYRVFKYPAIQEDDTASPSPKWMETARILLERAEHRLWNSSDGEQYLEYLHQRGLKDEIIKRKRLGYLPLNDKTGRMFEMSFDAWGLTQDMVSAEQWKKGCVRIPDGLLMPWFVNGNLWKLTVKRPFVGENEMGYGQILGGQECLYNVDLLTKELPAMMTESVIDALSVEQDAGDLVAVVATDSAARTRQPRWVASLCKASYVLQSFDRDAPGERGADEWLELLPEGHAIRWEPFAHDPNDMIREGQDIRKWVQLGMKMYQTPAMPLVAPTIDEETDEQEKEYSDDSLPQKCVVCGLDAELHSDVDFVYGEEGTLYCMEHCGIATSDDTSGTSGIEQGTVEEDIWIEMPPLSVKDAVLHFEHMGRGSPRPFSEEDADEIIPEEIIPYIPMTFVYTPLTLPPLPRVRCPYEIFTIGKNNNCTATPCKGRPLQHGWCAEHAYVLDMLSLGATLGYPEVQWCESASIGQGKPNWEAYAVRHAKRNHNRVMSAVKRTGDALFAKSVALLRAA